MTTTSTLRRQFKTGPNKNQSEQGLLPVFWFGLLAGLSLLAAVLVPIKRMLRRRRRRRAEDDRANHHHDEEEPGERTSLLSTPTLQLPATCSAGTELSTSSTSSSSVPTNTTNLPTADNNDGPGEHDGLLAGTDRPY